MARLNIGVVVGIALSFLSVAFFTAWESYFAIEPIYRSDPLRGVVRLLGSNFSFDIIAFFFSGNLTIIGFLAPALLAWIFVGYISGSIAKGLKNGVLAGIMVLVVILLLWILLNIVSGEDLMALFQGIQLFATLGGILSAIIGVILGSATGGYISGPEEEFY